MSGCTRAWWTTPAGGGGSWFLISNRVLKNAREGTHMGVWQTHPWVREGAGKIRFGIRVTARAAEVDWPMRRALAQAADALGFDSLWVPDHPAFLTDPWMALAAYASATSRVRLGPMVSCVAHRSPLMTAR